MNWIDAKDQLPAQDIRVLVANSEGEVYFAFWNWYRHWYRDEADIVTDIITHWMYPPRAPGQ